MQEKSALRGKSEIMLNKLNFILIKIIMEKLT